MTIITLEVNQSQAEIIEGLAKYMKIPFQKTAASSCELRSVATEAALKKAMHDCFGIWKNRKTDLASLRQKAWGGRGV